MSQNANAQNRTIEPQLKSTSANRPGSRLLDVAIVIYLVAFAAFVGLAAFGIHTEASKHSATVLLIVATVIPVATFLLFYVVFLLSSLAGIPLIGFSDGLSAIQRNSRGIAAAILLLAVVCAILAFETA